jgi:hypothetical protein
MKKKIFLCVEKDRLKTILGIDPNCPRDKQALLFESSLDKKSLTVTSIWNEANSDHFTAEHTLKTSDENIVALIETCVSKIPLSNPEKYDLCLMSDEQPKKGSFYVKKEKDGTSLEYSVLTLDGKLNKGTLTTEVLKKLGNLEKFNLETLKPLFEDILKITSNRGHTPELRYYSDLDLCKLHFIVEPKFNELDKNGYIYDKENKKLYFNKKEISISCPDGLYQFIDSISRKDEKHIFIDNTYLNKNIISNGGHAHLDPSLEKNKCYFVKQSDGDSVKNYITKISIKKKLSIEMATIIRAIEKNYPEISIEYV